MSWLKTNVKEEKIKFIGEWLKEEFTFSQLCQRYEISRKTGYKLIKRYETEGEGALEELSRKRHKHPNETAWYKQERLIHLKYRYPNWGPIKLRDWLLINEPQENWPSASTMGEILKRYGLVKPRKYRRSVPKYSEPFAKCEKCNQVWSADFKGQFRLGTMQYCYPLTITDNFSRYILMCKGLLSPSTEEVIKGFEKVFHEYGLPETIRTDNGQPFAGLGIGGLTRLSIWWLKLGIMPERIQAGHPEQNGRHERMHRTLKQETIRPAKKNMSAQQRSFNEFKQEYNEERPHQALNQKRPNDVHEKSKRKMPEKIPEITYPNHYEIRKVKTNGYMKWAGKRYYLTELLHQEPVGLETIDDGRAIVYFAKMKLGLIDARKDKIIRP